MGEKMKKATKVYVWFYYNLIRCLSKILVIIIATFIVILMSLLLADVFFPLGYSTGVVMSESMSPELEKGDLVILKKSESYAIGDIIAFKIVNNKTEYIHRIVGILKTGEIETKGDANNLKDSWEVSVSDVKGKVIVKSEGMGNVILFMKSVTGIILLLVIPATIVFTVSFLDIKSGIESKYKSIFS